MRTICPLLPVQRIYGQTPFALVAQRHCQPCVGCAKNCYDFNPRAAYLADLNDDRRRYWSGYRRFFVGAFPGLVLGFFTAGADVRRADRRHVRAVLRRRPSSRLALATSSRQGARRAHAALQVVYGGASRFSIFYWFTRRRSRPDRRRAPGVDGLRRCGGRARRDRRWLCAPGARSSRSSRSGAPAAVGVGGRRAGAARPAAAPIADAPGVTFVPDEQDAWPSKPGLTLLEIAEANGMPIEAGCRMGICGADPVAIKDGMDCLSPISDDERATLERLGLAAEHADGVLRACRTARSTVALTPGQARRRAAPQQVRGFSYDQSRRAASS